MNALDQNVTRDQVSSLPGIVSEQVPKKKQTWWVIRIDLASRNAATWCRVHSSGIKLNKNSMEIAKKRSFGECNAKFDYHKQWQPFLSPGVYRRSTYAFSFCKKKNVCRFFFTNKNGSAHVCPSCGGSSRALPGCSAMALQAETNPQELRAY